MQLAFMSALLAFAACLLVVTLFVVAAPVGLVAAGGFRSNSTTLKKCVGTCTNRGNAPIVRLRKIHSLLMNIGA
jgi:hypothetical protein